MLQNNVVSACSFLTAHRVVFNLSAQDLTCGTEKYYNVTLRGREKLTTSSLFAYFHYMDLRISVLMEKLMEPSCWIRIGIIRFRNRWVNWQVFFFQARWKIDSWMRIGVRLTLCTRNMLKASRNASFYLHFIEDCCIFDVVFLCPLTKFVKVKIST